MFESKILKPKFWDKTGFNFLSLILLPFSIITILVNLLKKYKTKKKFSFKTICVGNIYVGGTGKTQLVIKINDLIKNKFKTYVIKKFYKNQKDEQELLKMKTNLIVSKNRIDGLKIIDNSKKKVVIFDDGLQDKSIKYDLSIVCFNTSNGVGNGKLLPAGPLREQLNELNNYDAVFLNGEINSRLIKKIKIYNKKIKIFSGKYVLKNRAKLNLKKNYLAFCGIGNPINFFNLLKLNKIKIKKEMIFPDHYNYKLSDINIIKEHAKKNNLEIITTEKDFMKIKKFKKLKIKITKVDFELYKPKNFTKFLYSYL